MAKADLTGGPGAEQKGESAAKRTRRGKEGPVSKRKRPGQAGKKSRQKLARAPQYTVRPGPITAQRTKTQTTPSAAMQQHFIRLNRRRERQRTTAMATIVLLALVIVGILISLVSGRSGKKEQMQFINTGQIESQLPMRALLIREEQVLAAATEGLVEPVVSEGHKVGRDSLIARLLPPEEVSLPEELKQLNQDIEQRRREILIAGGDPEAVHINDLFTERINLVAGGLRKEAAANQLQDSEGYLHSVEMLLEEQNNALDSLASSDEKLQGLLNRRTALKEQIRQLSTPLTAPEAGLVSYKSDGLEDSLKPATAGQITADDFARYMKQAALLPNLADRVNLGGPVVRLVTDIKQYVLAEVPGLSVTAAADLPAHPVLHLKDPDIILKQCTVERVIPVDDHVMLLLSTDEALENLLAKRRVTGELRSQAISGLKIPRRAVIMADEEADVGRIRLVRKGYIAEETVKITAADSESVIISPLDPKSTLQAGDILVVNPDSVKEGQRID